MDFETDARDWLGGFPYEWTPADQIIRFCGSQVAVLQISLNRAKHIVLFPIYAFSPYLDFWICGKRSQAHFKISIYRL